MALTRITSGGIAEGVVIKFDQNNSPTAPAIGFEGAGNTGTGIYSPANNELAISTDGQARLTFKSDGKIIDGNGIILGGTNPDFENAENITLYVNQSDKNATDLEENDGGNLNRPFKTIERALLEAAKRSYKPNPSAVSVSALEVGKAYTIVNAGNTNFVSIGASSNTPGASFIATAQGTGTGTVVLSNDKFEAFTIMVLPGQYEIDNRPGYDITTNPLTAGTSVAIDAEPFRFNPRNGGVIVPRGTSIVGYDLRKTVIRPKYVPSPFSIDGSITSDGYILYHTMYDGANMIEKNRGYIQEQTKLYLQGNQAGYNGLNDAQKNLCVRDIGYFIDAIVKDLREGGNENTFNNAEYYIDGNGYRTQFLKSGDTDLSQEVAATVGAFNHAVSIMRFIAKSYNDNSISYSEITSGKTINRTTFSAGNGYVSDGDCSAVVNAVATLGAIATGILNNPDDYTREAVTVTLVGGGTATVKLRKTQGVFNQTSIFKVTGGCYFWQMTFKDAVATATKPIYNGASFDSNGIPTFSTTTDSKYSHHRVVAFTYADQRTTDGELDQYYRKIDAWQGRPDTSQVRPEEYTIVGDGSKNSTIDTVNSCSPYIFNCSLRSVFGMCGMHTDGSKVAENSFKSMVVAQFTGISLQKDRSVFIQPKDLEGDTDVTPGNQTVQYNDENPSTSEPPVVADPDAEYKPECRHFHIKASNGGFIQVVSVFAVGYADQFLAETGGDMSITNSNSNFGQISLRAKGSQFNSFAPASQGRITALIPPKGISNVITSTTFYSINADLTWSGLQATSDELTKELEAIRDGYLSTGEMRLYLETGAVTPDTIPELVVEGVDNSSPGGVKKTKRFLNYGTSNQYSLFRDFYSTSGETPALERKLRLKLESSDGNSDKEYTITVSNSAPSNTDLLLDPNNSERVGYFWDKEKRSIYIKLASDLETNRFISEFIFSFTAEDTFSFETIFDSNTNSTITQLVSGTKKVLNYKTGFPSNLTVFRYDDDRSSNPSDLLWRVEYTIPKYLPSNVNPKPPEKRFIIKGTKPGNGEDGIPYSDYRFLIWDVEEVSAWEKNSRDGVYYLTVIRSDINKFVDTWDSANSTNNVSVIKRRPTGITTGRSFSCKTIEEVNSFDKDTKLIGNVNYLYPSINEEGVLYDTRKIWNPPQTDSRVMVEKIGMGNRIKDISVPNYKRYNSVNSTTAPFRDVPALYSLSAESVHRLVQALDLRYVENVSGTYYASTNNIWVSPVISWDSRVGTTSHSATSNDVYNVNYRYGYDETNQTPSGKLLDSTTVERYNNFGSRFEPIDRRIIVCSPTASAVNPTSRVITSSALNNNSSGNQTGLTYAPVLPLYRPSILRASSHTWEYIGLGSGNYSTGFPNLQTRVLKIYEQFIAQGYENSGGFVASSGTNSAGDFYIGNQVIQAGGTSTVTLNVPKVRKSSESNFVDVENIENRISNAVINITTTGRISASQSALKDLTNYFNITKLNVSDKANISSLIVGRLFIDKAEINNAAFFPEGTTNAYGFTKAAKPEKTGFISTDTNDKLYVSPKYLDAWRVKRQLISAAAVTLDNNRVYIQPFLQSSLQGYNYIVQGIDRYFNANALQFTDTTVNESNVSLGSPKLLVAETSGIASFGKIDITMTLGGIAIQDYYLNQSNSKVYLNPVISIPLSYESVDYTTNEIVISKNQNGIPLVDYLKSYLGTGTHNTIIKNYPSVLASGKFGVNSSEGDIKFLKAKLNSNFDASQATAINKNNRSEYKTIQVVMNDAQYTQWPDRGCISLREYKKNGVYYIASYKYFKLASPTTNGGVYATFTLFENYSTGTNPEGATHTYRSDYDNLYPGINSVNVFFTGCDTLVFDSDRWASESAFIPPIDPTKGVVEEVNIEDAILYKVPEKKVPVTTDLNQEYFDKNLPNPYSSKALGVNIQERSEVKRFSPLFSFEQCVQWAEQSGFGSNDELELLMKPGYYKLDGSSFPCSVRINGTGVADGTEFAGKERTRTSAGRMGGYLEDTVKRGDSVYLYRTLSFEPQYGVGNDAIYTDVSGGLSANGSFNLKNVHIIGINESITKNEIPDGIFSSDKSTQTARRLVRNAYFIKKSIINDASTATDGAGRPIGNTFDSCGISGAIELMVKQNVDTTNNSGFNCIAYPVVNSGDIINSDRTSANFNELKDATFSNCRYYSIVIKASDFAGNAAQRIKYDRIRKYIIPGTTMFWLSSASGKVSTQSDPNTIQDLTISTKVLSVRKVNPTTSLDFDSNSTERIEVLISIYRSEAAQSNGNSADYTNSIEDLNPPAWASSLRKLVFSNDDGAELTTLMYNWALETRRSFLPKGFMHEGGYQGPILKTTTASSSAGSFTLTVNNTTDISIGDRITWLNPATKEDILSNFRISSISGNNLTLSNAIPTGVTIPNGSVISITKFNVFGDEVVKYDTPEIYGVLSSTDSSNIMLVIDRNPNKVYDSTISAYPYSSGSFGIHPTQLIQLKSVYNFPELASTNAKKYGSIEDVALSVNRVKASYQRINGIENDRYLFLDVDPNNFAKLGDTKNNPNPEQVAISGTYIENAGIHQDILVEFARYNRDTISKAGGLGKGFTKTTFSVNSSNVTVINTAISNAISSILPSTRNYNDRLRVIVSPQSEATALNLWRFYANINTNPANGTMGRITGVVSYWADSNTPATVLNGNYTITVIDGEGYVLSPSGRTVSTMSTLGEISSTDFEIVCKANLLAGVKLDPATSSVQEGSPYLESVQKDSTFTSDSNPLTAKGKKIFNSWPQSYRALRRRFPVAGMPINGNYQSTMISVNAIPGSDFKLNLSGVTIGAQSPADSSANTFGGGYRGGLIKCRGAQLTLSGTRFRGNLSLDWIGIATPGNSSRAANAGSSFIAGHSIEMFQMEDQNSFERIGGSLPAYEIRTSNLDEEFRQLSEFNPLSNVYLEPSKDPYGRLSDGDARTFPLKTKQAIRRFNKSLGAVTPWSGETAINSGDLLTKVALFERYQTPFGIYYNAPNGEPQNPNNISTGYVPTSSGNASGVLLRWRDNASQSVTYTVSGGTNITLPVNTLGFFIPNNPAGLDITSNIFFGRDASKLVKLQGGVTFVESTYALVKSTNQSSTKYNISNAGVITESANGLYVFISITYDRSDAFSSLTAATGTAININTDYLDSKRYNYVSTVTSRYSKIINNGFSKLVLAQDENTTTYAEPANYTITGETGTFTTNFNTSTVLDLVNESITGTTNGTVVVKTENGKLKSLSILSTGSGHGQAQKLVIKQGTVNVCPGLTFEVRGNYSDEDFSIFAPGEYKVMLPNNVFILNSIQNGNNAKNLKEQINLAKSIFKPGSYILHNGIYYKIATSNIANNFSYIGVYRYINPDNTSDIRADIVVELEDTSFSPTYGNNVRFDLFDNDNILNYWPSSGRLVIGNRETCDFTKSGTSSDPKGYEIRLSRSMTKYWPHYIRDWEGLDPNNSADSTVSSESIIPTEISLADPVDVTCYGLKRLNKNSISAAPDITEVTSGHEYTTPTGIVTNVNAMVAISAANTTEGITADFEKLSIGQTVTIPYKDVGSTTWNTFVVTVGDQQGVKATPTSTNRAGDTVISGSFRSNFESSTSPDETWNIHSILNTNDTSIYDYVNALTSAKFQETNGFIRTFNNIGFRTWSYLAALSGETLSTSTLSDTSGTGLASNVEGALHFTVSPAYARSMQSIASFADFNATFKQIQSDGNALKDPYEVLMTVTTVNDGAIYKGQPIYVSGTKPTIITSASEGSWSNTTTSGTYTSGNLIGYVVGMNGDVISTSVGSTGASYNYEDGSEYELTGNGGTGTYRVLLVTPYNNTSGTFGNLTFTNGVTNALSNLQGERASTDYFVYGSNQNIWWWENPGYRYIFKRRVLSDNTNVIYFYYAGTGKGLTTVNNDGNNGDLSLPSGSYVLFYYQGQYDNRISFKLDKPLLKDLPEGTQFVISPTPNRNKENNYLFKSRIMDLEPDSTHNRIKVYLADPLPTTRWQRDASTEQIVGISGSSSVKNYGLMYINDGGWTYPKTGGSAFRANNIKLSGSTQTSINIPNRSRRVRAGDILTYTWEDILRIQSNIGVSNKTITVNANDTAITIGGTNPSEVKNYIRPGYTIVNNSGNEVGVVSSVSDTTITLTSGAKNPASGTAFTYTSTGNTYTVRSVISTVGSLGADGFCTCTLSTPTNHILHNQYPSLLKDQFATIGDIFVSHRLGNFTNDGPITKAFIYSDTGTKLSFGEYQLWYENYTNYIQPHDRKKQAMSGRQGWVGNFGLNTEGRRTIGISLNGASSLQLGRQYNGGIWLSAVPVHALWENSEYKYYMMQSDMPTSVESNYGLSYGATLNYDGAGSTSLYALNHTTLTTGSIYGGFNSSETNSGGAGSYDTQHYKFSSSNNRLKYSLQNGTVSASGSVVGGTSSRLSEQITIDRLITYSPTHLNAASIRASSSGTVSQVDLKTITLSTTTLINEIQPGDVIYSANPPTPTTLVGIVYKVDYTTAKFELVNKVPSGTTSYATLTSVTPRGFNSVTSGSGVFAAQGLVFSGDSEISVTLRNAGATAAAYNVIGDQKPGYNRYNMRFNVGKRVYNQSTLLNTYDNLKPVDSFESANKVVDIKFGDLATYTSPLLNVEVTRFNPKTHIESSISVVGKPIHL